MDHRYANCKSPFVVWGSTKEGEKPSEVQGYEEDQSAKKERQNRRSERRRLQAQLRERAKMELEYVRAARRELHNIDIFPYKAREKGAASNRNMPRKMPLAGSTDVSKVRGFIRGFTTSFAFFPGEYGELADDSGRRVSPIATTDQQEVVGLAVASPVIPDREGILPVVCELAVPEQASATAAIPEEVASEAATATHTVAEQYASAAVIDVSQLSKIRAAVPMAGEEEVERAKFLASAVPKKSFASIVKHLLAFGIVSPTAAPELRATAEKIAEMEAHLSGTAACAAPGPEGVQERLGCRHGAHSATDVAKTLSRNISRSHPLCYTLLSILKPNSTADSSSSSSSEDDEPNLPVYRTLSVQRRSCLRRRKPFWYFRMNRARVGWARNADEAVYIQCVAPVVSLLPPETVKVRSPCSDVPPTHFKFAFFGDAAERAAAAAVEAAAAGDPDRQAAADAAAAAAAELAREAAQEAAEAAAAEAKAVAEEESKALARLRTVAAVLADSEARKLQAKARAGVLRRDEFDRWRRRLEEN
ncbi:uncharacterized protein EMH_0039800 [Eimeria mitis]|uniref:Uncharacterized protein n=1 Tax=Eimeria mitis TaxID=44415 RepID=U6K3T7_9EIME|nr:uncharacterized protein EMH_0039800 [Eimeria mitis]CDJ31656.1 hypothetical protein, conserved [Eimeria mitis]